MTDKQINAAIAEACGWEWKPINCGGADFCNDLNAMHEAEKTLTCDEVFFEYYLALYETTRSTRWPVCATARQRSEAFLRTIGKWEEVQA